MWAAPCSGRVWAFLTLPWRGEQRSDQGPLLGRRSKAAVLVTASPMTSSTRAAGDLTLLVSYIARALCFLVKGTPRARCTPHPCLRQIPRGRVRGLDRARPGGRLAADFTSRCWRAMARPLRSGTRSSRSILRAACAPRRATAELGLPDATVTRVELHAVGRTKARDCARWHVHETISTRIGGFRKEDRGEGQGEEQEVGQGRQQA